jgi:hypothetical protein
MCARASGSQAAPASSSGWSGFKHLNELFVGGVVLGLAAIFYWGTRGGRR